MTEPTLAELLQELREAVDGVGGCGDNSCRFRKPKGMATNGGCSCIGRGGDYCPKRPGELSRLYRVAAKVTEFVP